jgi:23S rRNA (guanosine2251-2'-O)-methyltransferase
VEEAFVARRPALRLLVVPQRRQALERIVLHATSLRIPIVEVEGGTLTSVAGFDGHQGVALVVRPRTWASLADVLARAAERGEPPFILALDSLEDPQNVGTLLRSAEAVGAHGVVFPTHHQAPLSPAAIKASAGATEHLLLVPVDDLPGALADLRVRGVRIVGADEDAPLTARQADLRGPLALVVGSEGQGIGPAVRRRIDLSIRIPMRGAIGSLNAAVAGSVLLFEILEQRGEAPTEPHPRRGADREVQEPAASAPDIADVPAPKSRARRTTSTEPAKAPTTEAATSAEPTAPKAPTARARKATPTAITTAVETAPQVAAPKSRARAATPADSSAPKSRKRATASAEPATSAEDAPKDKRRAASPASSAETATSGQAATSAEEAPKPKRRAASSSRASAAKSAPSGQAAPSADDAPKPKGRARSTTRTQAEATAEAAPPAAESTVQKRRAKSASPAEPSTNEEPAAKPRRTRRTASAEPAASDPDDLLPGGPPPIRE